MSAGRTAPGPLMGHPRAALRLDVGLALIALLYEVGVVLHSAPGLDGNKRAAGLVLALAASAPLVVWRRAPVRVFVVTVAASATIALLGVSPGPPLGATIALYLLANSRDRSRPWTRTLSLVVAAMFTAHFIAFGVGHHGVSELTLVAGGLVWAVAWFAGERGRLRRVELQEFKERAIRAERELAQERRLALAEERSRIARDLHDSAAHAINVIAVQAGAARLHLDRDRRRSREALETIEDVARRTAADIDQIVHRLRERAAAADAPVEPPTGLAGLGSLLAQHRQAGRTVEVHTTGADRPLGTSVDQTAYRILQEALTNSARHGNGPATIRLEFRRDGLQLTVANRALPATAQRPGGGHGLVGMRERAALLGGRLEAGIQGDEFHVHALLPYDTAT